MIGAKQGILHRLAPGAAMGIIRLRSMGDTVLTTPALALLKRARPDLRVLVVVERPWDRLLEGNPAVDEVVRLPNRWAAIAALRRARVELCLNLHGGPTSAWMTLLSGARWRAGFGHFAPSAMYNVPIPRAQEILGLASDAPVHTAEHLASAMMFLGAPRGEIPAARLFAGPSPHQGGYAVVHVAAAAGNKRWPAERFAELGRWLRRGPGLEAVMLAGPGQGTVLASLGEFTCLDHLSLGEMMALLQGAQLFVGNDSGPAHVAAAFGVPCVVIFGPSNAAVWHPWRTRHQVVQAPTGSILDIDVEMVRRAVEVLAPRPALQP